MLENTPFIEVAPLKDTFISSVFLIHYFNLTLNTYIKLS